MGEWVGGRVGRSARVAWATKLNAPLLQKLRAARVGARHLALLLPACEKGPKHGGTTLVKRRHINTDSVPQVCTVAATATATRLTLLTAWYNRARST